MRWREASESPLAECALRASLLTAILMRISGRTDFKAEIERVKRKPPTSLDAYDHYLRGISGFRLNSREGNDDALHHFLKAVALDLRYASAYGMAAYCRHRRRVWG